MSSIVWPLLSCEVGHQGRVLNRAHQDLNQGPADVQSAALTTELCTQIVRVFFCWFSRPSFSNSSRTTEWKRKDCSETTRHRRSMTAITASLCQQDWSMSIMVWPLQSFEVATRSCAPTGGDIHFSQVKHWPDCLALRSCCLTEIIPRRKW